jgi:hypothetical protein
MRAVAEGELPARDWVHQITAGVVVWPLHVTEFEATLHLGYVHSEGPHRCRVCCSDMDCFL